MGTEVAETATRLSVFAKRLAQARQRMGVSQKQLGVLAGLEPHVASPRINQYERGVHEPPLETARQLAKALGVPAAFLYAEDDQLAKLLLLWSEMSASERRKLVKDVEAQRSQR
ncbi:helix-turn-helix domain-containing protein [Lysobacter sp. MMG2]|uniref:helix-turn-helix domain-containing protein n=1 Tax=Lysobacter sp. MMG2 TaxID=2801338 RepID=UPI001C221324|nr:helix-turn-helix transcriptional regulator [Lysobacter sp. MMG2]MBU8977753.1 helix-turn-helix domain-containing protein [Lysobacter sp. MMG2]